VKKKREKPDLPEDPDERFDLISESMLFSLKGLLADVGYEDFKLMLFFEAPGDPIRVASMATGFESKPEAFEFIMERATEFAEAVGIRMIATHATGPASEGQG
jgi:hypothetical protein